MYPARNAPLSAPTVVATSKNMPTRMFEYPSFKYAAAAPDEVAITETSEAPIAYRISTPNTKVSSGTITTPPPSPVNAPSSPAAIDPAATINVNSKLFNAAILFRSSSGHSPAAALLLRPTLARCIGNKSLAKRAVRLQPHLGPRIIQRHGETPQNFAANRSVERLRRRHTLSIRRKIRHRLPHFRARDRQFVHIPRPPLKFPSRPKSDRLELLVPLLDQAVFRYKWSK